MKNLSSVHFIGIGGISMSAIAKVLLHNNIKVSGSDFAQTDITNELSSLGATIYIGQRKENIKDCDLCVYTAAISEDNEELIEARKKGIKVITRAQMLGEIMKNYKNAISVSGTHGKTTTTSMMTYVLMKAHLDPTIMVGGNLDIIDGNFKMGNGDYFVTESCEYHRSFLNFFPKLAIILNVEEDHLDYYKDLSDIKDAFTSFANIVPPDGYVIANADSENVTDCLKETKAKVVTYGKEKGDYLVKNIRYDDFGYPTFDIYLKGDLIDTISLSVYGEHNTLNALSVYVASLNLGIDKKYIKEGLEAFKGTKRRFEKKGEFNGALIIDDYAHHPTEIKATLKNLEKIKHNNLWCVFQPHTYTRTKALFNDFVNVFKDVKNLIITDIYAAREKDTGIVSSKDLASKLPDCLYMSDFDEIASYIKDNCQKGDIIITIGAGSVYKIGEIIK